VREVVLGAILLPFLPAGAATAVVATSRVVQTLGDALWALFAGIALRGPMRRAEQRLRVDDPAPTDAAADQSPADPARASSTGATAGPDRAGDAGQGPATAGRGAGAGPATGATTGPSAGPGRAGRD
jgi:hypothetical protein